MYTQAMDTMGKDEAAKTVRSAEDPFQLLIYTSTMKEVNPIFIAYGVAMCGIGMLTLTGNTISMDVFGPVADLVAAVVETLRQNGLREVDTVAAVSSRPGCGRLKLKQGLRFSRRPRRCL